MPKLAHHPWKEKRKPRPDESWSIELDPPPCQDQSTKALQDVLDREPEDDREQDREVVKGVHDTSYPENSRFKQRP